MKLQRAQGTGRLTTKTRNDTTHIDELFQEGCAKIRLPKTHSSAMEAVLINTSGGLTGGDALNWHIKAADNSRLTVTTQACERAYKSLGDVADVKTCIDIGKNARLDWLPQETILFDHSHLRRTLEVNLADSACFTAVEAIVLGREAMGEQARSARFSDNWRIRRNGRLVHAEANKLSAFNLERDGLSTLARNTALATILFIAENAETRLDDIRALISPNTKAETGDVNVGTVGASALGEKLIVRVLAPNGLALRRIITPIVKHLSSVASLPRLWST